MTTAYWSEGFGEAATALEAEAGLDLKSRVLAYERRLIEAALVETRGNQRRAARLLGILPTTLNEKLKRFGLRAEGPRSPEPTEAVQPEPETGK